MLQRGTKVLISTSRPTPGGVQVMLSFVIDCLRQQGCSITLAYYQPYSVSPELSVPFFKLPLARPAKLHTEFDGQPCVGLGCWLPELEVTHYWQSRDWKQLIDSHEVHIAVGGSCFSALCLHQHKIPFLAWVASDWRGDRQHRVRQMPLLRRLLDRVIVTPVARRLEAAIVRSGNLIALSEPTRLALNQITGETSVTEILPMPIDADLFSPAMDAGSDLEETGPSIIGFVGRFEDPRKNLGLLFTALAEMVKSRPDLELHLIGDELSNASRELMHSLGIEQHVIVSAHVPRADLPRHLRAMKVFVLPSHQEGLCIAALEAMSCAVPVVSTRCGGPESFIQEGINGRLVDHEATQLSDAVLQLLSDGKQRKRYASAAREVIISRYSRVVQMRRFMQLVERTYISPQHASASSTVP